MTQDNAADAGPELGRSTAPETGVSVSVIIMTKNEARVIGRTVDSVKDFAEVFVVDSHSDDDTQAIAKAHGANVVPFTWNGQYPKKKQWCLENLPFTQDWILYLDADEIVTPELAREIAEATKSPQISAYDVDLDYVFLGRRLRHGHKVSKRVLAARAAVTWPQVDDLGATNMWEVEGHYQPRVSGEVGKLKSHLIHNDIDPLFTYFERHNRYSDWEAHLRLKDSQSAYEHRTIRAKRYANMPGKPLAFFIYSYIMRRGLLDGSAGFHYAVANAFYYWQTSVKAQELLRQGE